MTWFECELPPSKEVKKWAFKLNKYDKAVLQVRNICSVGNSGKVEYKNHEWLLKDLIFLEIITLPKSLEKYVSIDLVTQIIRFLSLQAFLE